LHIHIHPSPLPVANSIRPELPIPQRTTTSFKSPFKQGEEVERVRPGSGKHQLNGRDVSRQEVLEALGGPGGHDDSDQLYVTVIGGEADRRQVLDDLDSAPPLAPWKGRLKVHGYEPAHWAVQDAGFKTDGRPTIYVQAPDGKVLHRQDEYRGPE